MRSKYFSFRFLLKSLLAFVILFFLTTAAANAWTCGQLGGYCETPTNCRNLNICSYGCNTTSDCATCCFADHPATTPTPTPPATCSSCVESSICKANAECGPCPLSNCPNGSLCCQNIPLPTATPIPPTPTPTPDACLAGLIVCHDTTDCDKACPGEPCVLDPGSTTLRHCQPKCGDNYGGVQGNSCLVTPCCAGCGFVFQCYRNSCNCAHGKCPATCPGPKPTATPGPPTPPCTKDSVGNCTNINTGIGAVNLADNGTGFVGSIFGILLGFSGGIAILLIMYSGLRLITAQANPEKIQQSREIFTAAIVGLLFVIFSVVILEVIGIDIFHIPGLSR